jgi:hypothetical protein
LYSLFFIVDTSNIHRVFHPGNNYTTDQKISLKFQ